MANRAIKLLEEYQIYHKILFIISLIIAQSCIAFAQITFKEPGAIIIRGGEYSFIGLFPIIESKIKQLYEI